MSAPTPCEPHGPPLRVPAMERGLVLRQAAHASVHARLEVAAASSMGARHSVNEDACSGLDHEGLYVVADGVGGGALAAHASREVVDRVHESLRGERIDAEALRRTLLEVDAAVARSIAERADEPGAATVVLGAALQGDFASWLVAWVGDCRAYRLAPATADAAELLTRDDTYRHLAETPPNGSTLDDPARMIGNGAVDAPNIVAVELGDDALLVLCSDGVHRRVTARDLARLLLRDELPLGRRCALVVMLARRRGETDDATVLAIRRSAADGAGRQPARS